MTPNSVCKRFFLLLVLCLLAGTPALGQDAERELQQENEQLRQQVRDLQQQLDDAEAQVARLERLVERLEAQLENRSASDEPLEEPEVTIDESKPEASPRALFAAIVESHDEAMSDIDMDRPNSRQRTAYMRALDRWVAAANRQFKLPIEWHVRIVGDLLLDRLGNARATVVAVDPVTDAELGSPFDVILESAIVRRLNPVMERGEVDKLLLNGVAIPQIRINLERPERGAFDSPRYVGPFVEYMMDMEVRSLVPVEKPKESPPKREGQGTPENTDRSPSTRPRS